MPSIAVGLTLQPEPRYLELVEPLLGFVDYLEVTPETMWDPRPGHLGTNAFAELYFGLAERHAKGSQPHLPFVAHGVGLSIGDLDPAADPEREAWIQRLAQNHRRFAFRWMSDHLGTTTLAGETMALPLPVPPTPRTIAAIRARAPSLRRLHPLFALENTAHLFSFGPPLAEVDLFASVTRPGGFDAVLDLYNVWMMAENGKFDVLGALTRLDLRAVIEIHLAGGSESDPTWLSSGRRLLVDTHDQAVPEPVWTLLDAIGPRCPNLRGVTLERMEGALGPDDAHLLAYELKRVREVVSRWS